MSSEVNAVKVEEKELAEEEAYATGAHKKRRVQCPYLGTINRTLLDFDFEKVCSVTLSNLNVYACLVCGKYFQGRGMTTQAHAHSLNALHHVFINLNTAKVYCLPDNYEVHDSSLDDIKYVLDPHFTREQVVDLDKPNQTKLKAFDGVEFFPGCVGMNNIKANDGINSVLQCLVRIPDLRNYFINRNNYVKYESNTLVARFGELVRKLWSTRKFRAHLSPHEILQAISDASKKKFVIGKGCDPIDFLSWFLNTLHRQLGGTGKRSSIITKCFQGEMLVRASTKKKIFTCTACGYEDEDRHTFEGHLIDHRKKQQQEQQQQLREQNDPIAAGEGAVARVMSGKKTNNDVGVQTATKVFEEDKTVKYMFLAVDVPPPPLFKDEKEQIVIPQMPLVECLEKFNGHNITERPLQHQTLQYAIKRLPKYLIMHLKRFSKNSFFIEKNPTIVTFQVRDLEMGNYVITAPNVPQTSVKYEILSNIRHDGLKPDEGHYRVDVNSKVSRSWYSIRDIEVREEKAEEVAFSESYIQFWGTQRD
eukprot:TRINITY_DN2309_c0_g3_i1.p1 TRINITY_DN2309_c0_g3~~TRINITY_DN2309_c0_g3_i1.p1  ORF type:complete len:533 (+),score=155.79 TRINITY_DN2309_c0_g3_i1:28-1626(+)